MAKIAPLVVIVGETASGKSELAMLLAGQFNGEIIAADSRTVYRGMDIGTAKPSMQDQARISHHLLDVVDPDEPFTAADFKRLAEAAIKDIHDRGKLPIMVGGSGLYIDAVLFDYKFSDTGTPRDPDNPRHLSKDIPRQKSELRPRSLIIGLRLEHDALRQRIEQRVDAMVQAGLVEEARKLLAAYPDSKALLTPGYKAFVQYLQGELSLEEAKVLFIHNDMQLAKRQRTWFKRNKSIHWIEKQSKAVELVTTLLTQN